MISNPLKKGRNEKNNERKQERMTKREEGLYGERKRIKDEDTVEFSVKCDNEREREGNMVKERTLRILKDTSNPGHTLFELLPSGRRYRSINYKQIHEQFYLTALTALSRIKKIVCVQYMLKVQ